MFSQSKNIREKAPEGSFKNKNKVLSFVLLSFLTIILTGHLFRGNQYLGFFATAIIITLVCHAREGGFRQIGLVLPDRFGIFLTKGVILGLLIAVFDFIFLQPFSHLIFQEPYTTDTLNKMRGDSDLLYYWVLYGWFGIAFSEEYIFRGFFLKEITNMLGNKKVSAILGAIICSLIVGALHFGHQNTGMFSKFILSLIFFVVYFRFDKNLWLLMIAHGVLNTTWFVLIYFNIDHIYYY